MVAVSWQVAWGLAGVGGLSWDGSSVLHGLSHKVAEESLAAREGSPKPKHFPGLSLNNTC